MLYSIFENLKNRSIFAISNENDSYDANIQRCIDTQCVRRAENHFDEHSQYITAHLVRNCTNNKIMYLPPKHAQRIITTLLVDCDIGIEDIGLTKIRVVKG